MTSEEIAASIQYWELIRQDSETINAYLSQGNHYYYEFPEYAQTSDSLHAYPGIYNDELYFFMIPSKYDNEAYKDVIDQYTTPCLLVNSVGGTNDRLTTAEAKARIKAWQNNYQVWVPAQINGPYGIFEAFAIPTQDFEIEDVVVTLGLKIQTSATGGFQADLIVTNTDGKQVVYDDMAQPVPPFSAVPSQEEFYLLSDNI